MSARTKYATDAERRAFRAERERERRRRKRIGEDEWERTRRRKEHEAHYPPTPCACGCGKLLTVAALRGGSAFATRECAGFAPAPSRAQAEADPTSEDLEGQPPAEGQG